MMSFEQNKEEEQSLQKADQSFAEFLSTLPRDYGWTPLFDCYLYQGCWYYLFFLRGVIAAQQHFEAQPTDIFLCSVPKSGTTWLKALVFAIVTRKKYSDLSSHPLLSTMPHECIPFLEVDVDAFVSLWNFANRVTPKDTTHISLEEALELFCKGVSYYGPYWDHVLGFWKARKEAPQRLLFLVYEEMRKNPLPSVKNLADFIGHPFSVEEENEGVPQKIAELCSFENLSNLDVNKKGKHRPESAVAIENRAFFRKSKIGDWRSHLTPEMAERLDQITREKFGGTGLPSYVSDANTHDMHKE
ncbi:Sulfotransferase domain [Dillenia turbinata]|uniref:Sulfotransferase n=1 Tax=Dillenia turbinata TaxID=194707 RepID=A0AAN8V0M9_9MAGN